MDKVALKRWILLEENSQKACEGARKANNAKLLKQIDSRWVLDRAENSGTCKKPLLNHEEWWAIETGLWKEERVRNAMGDQGMKKIRRDGRAGDR